MTRAVTSAHWLPPAVAANPVMLTGLACLLLPTLYKLSQQLWPIKEQGHGPVFFDHCLDVLEQGAAGGR
jgi:hypothetical protein